MMTLYFLFLQNVIEDINHVVPQNMEDSVPLLSEFDVPLQGITVNMSTRFLLCFLAYTNK